MQSKSAARSIIYKIYCAAPVFFGCLGILLILLTSPVSEAFKFLVNVFSGIIAIIIVIKATSRMALCFGHHILFAIIYGEAIYFLGSFGFSIPNFVLLNDCTLRSCLAVPVGWISFYAIPISVVCGIFLVGASQNFQGNPPDNTNDF